MGHVETHPYQSRELWHKVMPNVVPSMIFFSENYIRDTNFWHNFVPQLSTWRVVIGKDMSVDHVETYSYQSQLAMCRVVAQNCAKLGTWRVVIGKSMSVSHVGTPLPIPTSHMASCDIKLCQKLLSSIILFFYSLSFSGTGIKKLKSMVHWSRRKHVLLNAEKHSLLTPP